MNWAQLHLALVHVPVVGAFFSLVLFALALKYRSDLLFRIACGFTVFCALAAAVSYFTGGEAFEAMMAELDSDVVEDHALVSRGAFLLYTLGGVGALVALLQELQEEPAAPALRWALLAVNAVVFVVLLWAAHLGGLIRHPEIAPPVESIATLFL
jgi:succinate dehydrogenase/fumarate reductase cytochrome b subunit